MKPSQFTEADTEAFYDNEVGVGAGRGIGLLLILMGMFNTLAVVLGYFYPRLRLVEDELPDVKSNDYIYQIRK